RQRVGVEILRSEPAVPFLDRSEPEPPVGPVDDVEDALVIATTLDRRSEGGHEGQPGDAEFVCPDRPDPGLVYERLAHVETDPSAHQMSRSSRPALAKASRQVCSSSRLCSLVTIVRIRARSSAT